MKLRTKKFISKFFYCFFTLFFIISASTYIIYQFEVFNKYNSQVLELEEEIKEARDEQEDLKNQLEYQNSDEYIEKMAREKLGMIRSNEIVFIDKNR